MDVEDIAGKQHWDQVYGRAVPSAKEWRPKSYIDFCIDHVLMSELSRTGARTILEVGCGNSPLLPHLAKKTGATVAGIDYSENGCQLATNNLNAAGIDAEVFCIDIFDSNYSHIPQYDFVCSFGLVEHFTDPVPVLTALSKFVKPGGTLFTQLPNLLSFHGALAFLYQPKLLAKHKLLSKKELSKAYATNGYRNIIARHVGVFSLDIISWGHEQRFPLADKVIIPIVKRLSWRIDRLFNSIGWYKGTPFFSPFIYVTGQKVDD